MISYRVLTFKKLKLSKRTYINAYVSPFANLLAEIYGQSCLICSYNILFARYSGKKIFGGLICSSGKYVILAMQPRSHDCDVGLYL